MTTAIETPTTAIEITTAPVEPTDEALIARAKSLNKTMETHLRKGIEAFWKLGEALHFLYQRRHLRPDGRWSSVLKEIGISTTTDNHAQRFYRGCRLEEALTFKNKTAALRALGIMASPEGAKKKQADKATKPTVPTAPIEPNGNGEDVGNARKDASPTEGDNDITQEPRDGAKGVEPRVKDWDKQVPKPGVDKDLLTLSQIAALLEEVANQGLAPTGNDLAQLDRIAAAVARLKEVARAA
jgi:hypothetical protein